MERSPPTGVGRGGARRRTGGRDSGVGEELENPGNVTVAGNPVEEDIEEEDDAQRIGAENLIANIFGVPDAVVDQPQAGAPIPPVGGPPPPPPADEDEDEDEDEEEEDNMARVNANQLQVLGTFSGEGDDDAEAYVAKVAQCATSFQWTPDVTKTMVELCLRGIAARWLRSLDKTVDPAVDLNVWQTPDPAFGVAPALPVGAPPGVREFIPGSGLRHQLLLRFKKVVSEGSAVEAVIDLKQRAGETVDDFFDRVVMAMDAKNHRATEAEKQDEAYRDRLRDDVFTFFAAGMNDEVRRQALGGPEASRPTNAAALLIAARNSELERKKAKKPKFLSELDAGLQNLPGESGSDDGFSQAAGGASAEQFAGLSELMQQLDVLRHRVAGMADIDCWSCGKKGHYSFNCVAKGGGAISARGRGGSSGRGRGRGGSAPRAPPAKRFYLKPAGQSCSKSAAPKAAGPTAYKRKQKKKLYELVEVLEEDETSEEEDEDEDDNADVVVEASEVAQEWYWPTPNEG